MSSFVRESDHGALPAKMASTMGGASGVSLMIDNYRRAEELAEMDQHCGLDLAVPDLCKTPLLR